MKKIKCRLCNKKLSKENFYNNRRVCKKCYRNVESNRKVEKGLSEIERMKNNGIITLEEEGPALTLFFSCCSRISACKNDPNYKDVKCNWKNPTEMTMDIINHKKDMWKAWKEQDRLFSKTKDKKDRPSIDRINNAGHYNLENIQMLSVIDNNLKDKGIFNFALLFYKSTPMYSFEFTSKKEMKNKLKEFGVEINVDKIALDVGILQNIGNGYSVIIQSLNGTVSNEHSQTVTIVEPFQQIDEDTKTLLNKYRFYNVEASGIEFVKKEKD